MDGSGKIEYSEFLIACIDRTALLSDTNLELAFKMFDKSGNGKITTRDVKHVFSDFNLHDRVVQDLIKQADMNSAG